MGCDHWIAQTTQPERAFGRPNHLVLSAGEILALGQNRGIENEWLAMETELPGLGGISIDSGGNVRAYLENRADSTAARSVIASFAQERPDLSQRPDGTPRIVHFLRGEFAFSELVSWSETLIPTASPNTGMRFIDANEGLNRVSIGVANANDEAPILRQARQLGIPDGAIAFTLMPGTIRSVVGYSVRPANPRTPSPSPQPRGRAPTLPGSSP